MTGIGTKIKERRELLGWSQTKLATLAGISQSFLWRIEAGRTQGSWDTYTKLASAMGQPVDVFLPNRSNVEEAHPGWRRVPILDYVEAGRWAGYLPAGNEEMRDVVLTDLEHPPSTFAMRLKGDSMEPEFREGDIVVIAPTVAPRPGDLVVARDESGSVTFKQYREIGRNEKGQDVFELIALNPLYPRLRSDVQAITIVGTMVEHRRYRRP